MESIRVILEVLRGYFGNFGVFESILVIFLKVYWYFSSSFLGFSLINIEVLGVFFGLFRGFKDILGLFDPINILVDLSLTLANGYMSLGGFCHLRSSTKAK